MDPPLGLRDPPGRPALLLRGAGEVADVVAAAAAADAAAAAGLAAVVELAATAPRCPAAEQLAEDSHGGGRGYLSARGVGRVAGKPGDYYCL